jgi:hypothetical protein
MAAAPALRDPPAEMPMKRLLPVLAIVALCVAVPARAQKIYKCRNEKGEIYYSQSYDTVRCAGGGARLNQQGVAVKEYDRVKTAEELAADKAAAAQKAEADRIAAEQAKSDQVLLMSYANEDDLKRAHVQEMQMIDTAVATAKLQLENQQRTLASLLSLAAEAERAKKPVPENIAKSIGKVRSQIEEQNTFMVRQEEIRAQSSKDFEAVLARYRDLVAKQAARH